MQRPFSILITTHNEATNLPRTLAAIQNWTDDLLIVDSFSTDQTPTLAAAAGARVEQRQYQGPADQKNWAIPRARHKWLLILDADEVVRPELRTEIDALLNAREDPAAEVYWIGRNNYFMGRRIKYSGWQNDSVVRLILRDRARYHEVQVHEEIDTTGLQVGCLRGRLDHYTFRSLDHFLAKMRRYARWSARDHAARTGKIGAYHLLIKPLFRFWKHYIVKSGWRDGAAGLVVAAVMAWGVFLRYAYMLEERKSTGLN